MNERKVNQLATSPTFTKKVLIPASSTPIVILRYYAPPGGGLDEQWKSEVAPLTFTYNGKDVLMELYFSFNSVDRVVDDGFNETAYIKGQQNGGFDQHAQYYQAQLELTSADTELVISGSYPRMGYMSVVIYDFPMYQYQILDTDMICAQEGGSPVIPSNPSIFSYDTITKESSISLSNKTLPSTQHTSNNITLRDGEINFFRPDRNTSLERYTEDIASDGYSRAYLYANMQPTQEMLILRIKVPTTFIHSNELDPIFEKYQCRELSISSNISENDPLTLNFWTISSLMLNSQKDSEGYAYVFFAPNDFVTNQISITRTPDYIAPILTWGNYTGYVLGLPTEVLPIRYRGPSNDWKGNPENALPSPTPVTSDMLGEWLPELFGDTMDNFENGTIGAVNNTQPWPAAE